MRGVVIAVMVLAGATMVSVGAPPAASRPAEAAVPGNLRAAMNAMLRSYSAMKEDIAKGAARELIYRDIALFERDAAISKTFVPGVIGRIPAEKRAEAVADYRGLFNGLLRALLELEEAVEGGKPAAEVKGILKEIDEIITQGHEEFVPVN